MRKPAHKADEPALSPANEPGEPEFWFERPSIERMMAAAGYEHVPLTALVLTARPRNVLLRQHRYRSVSDLMRAGPEVRTLRQMGVGSLRQIETALLPYFDVNGSIDDPAGESDALAVVPTLMRISELADYAVQPWFGVHPSLRQPAADALMDSPLSQLSFAEAEEAQLVRYGLLTVGQLTATGPGIVLEVPEATLRRAHDGLLRLAAALIPVMQHKNAIEKALDRLRARDDLQSMSLAALLFSPTFIANARQIGVTTVEGLVERAYRDVLALTDLETPPALFLEQCQWAADLPPQPSSEDIAIALQSVGIHVVPLDRERRGGPDLSTSLQRVVRALVLDADENEWTVLRHRFGLLGAKQHTLQEIGNVLGVTRERVRQLEARALKWLAQRVELRPLSPSGERMHPSLLVALDELVAVVDEVRRTPVRESLFMQRTGSVLASADSTAVLDPGVAVVADALGLKRRDLATNHLEAIWHALPTSDILRLELQIRAIHHALTNHPGATFTELELVAHTQQAAPDAGLTLANVAVALSLTTSAEPLADGRYRARSACLSKGIDVAERVLMEAGTPLHVSDIARAIASLPRLTSRSAAMRSLSNTLSTDDRFVPIGRSGMWALRAWSGVETDTIVELMVRCLAESNCPMTMDELHSAVVALRPTTLTSIHLYLSMDARFSKASRDTWGLASWMELKTAVTWDREQVARFVLAQFTTAGVHELPQTVLRDALAAEAGVHVQTARGMLASLRALKSRRASGGIPMAVLPSDFAQRVKAAYAPQARRRTLLDEVAERVVAMLTEAPNHELPLHTVRQRLVDDLARPTYTIYGYIQRANVSETYVGVDGRTRMVRLRGKSGGEGDPSLRG